MTYTIAVTRFNESTWREQTLFMNNNKLYRNRKSAKDTIFTCDNNIITQNIEGIIIRTNNKYYINLVANSNLRSFSNNFHQSRIISI